MILKNVVNEYNSNIIIRSIGFENDSSQAHYGPAVRDAYILHYVIKGTGFFNGQRLSKGQGFVIEKNALHEYHSDNEDPWQYLWLIFDGETSCLEHCFKNTGVALYNSIFDFAFLTELLLLAEKLIVDNEGYISSAKALSYFYSIISLHETINIQNRKTSASDTHIQNAILFIENNYHTNIKITDIAKHIFVNDRYLYNLFMNKLNISPKRYLNKLRLTRACQLLSETSLSITNIGESVGYNEILSFSAFFKKHIHLSPSEYRSTHRHM